MLSRCGGMVLEVAPVRIVASWSRFSLGISTHICGRTLKIAFLADLYIDRLTALLVGLLGLITELLFKNSCPSGQ